MANFGGRYTCLDCDVDGAVDVRRVAPERRVNDFPLATSAYAQAIAVPRAVRKPRGLPSKPGFEGKGYSRKLRRHQSKLRSLPWQPRLSSRSLGYRCGMPVCERTRSARCTASECKDASGCKDDTRLRGLLLGRVHRKMRRWRASRSSRCWASASAWCSERRIKSRSSAAAGSRQVFARVSLQ